MESSTDFLSCITQDNRGHTIRVLRPYIEKKVTFHHVAAQMSCMRDIYGCILESKDDSKKAADIFFKRLEEIRDPGKYQEFITALEINSYPLVANVIENGEISITDEENQRLIELFLIRLAEAIDPGPMSEMLFQRQLIEGHEKDRIRNLSKQDSSVDAALYLLTKVHCRKRTWYQEFLEILWDMDHRNLVKDIDDKFYTKKQEQCHEDLVDSSLLATSIDSTEPCLHQTRLTQNLELPSSPLLQDMAVLTEENTCNVKDLAPEKKDIFEEMLNQLKYLSNQMALQRDAVAQVSDRLMVIEKKVDHILEKS